LDTAQSSITPPVFVVCACAQFFHTDATAGDTLPGAVLKHGRASVSIIDIVTLKSVNKLTAHYFIAKSQAQYLKSRKNDLADTCVFLPDFAENSHCLCSAGRGSKLPLEQRPKHLTSSSRI